MEFRIIIPARYHSTRFPGKVLAKIAGKPMIHHVFDRAIESGAKEVIIATDDDRIVKVAQDLGAVVCMTSSEHQSGTERLAEAAVALGIDDDEIVLCVQADEPLMSPLLIHQLADDLYHRDNVKISSVCVPITDPADMNNPNIVKVVLNYRHYALYFSRAPIPFSMHAPTESAVLPKYCYRHLGIYAYYASFLKQYIEWNPSPIEDIEKLEQLRILWHAGRIHMMLSQEKTYPCVDRPEDIAHVERYL